MVQTFFEEPRDQSLVKAAIVAKYFNARSRVMIANAAKGIPSTRLAYIDLFAGPGRYKDGSKSTPLMVLERAIADDATVPVAHCTTRSLLAMILSLSVSFSREAAARPSW